jgi:prophage maintenance system killer protein
MPAPRSTAKAAPVPSSTRPGRKQTALERENSARKREALERFVDKNAKVLAELAK